jgi:uncharacterized protein
VNQLYEWILIPLAFLIAVFAAASGVGGGVLFVPLLTLGWGFSPSVAVGTSLFAMIFGGLGATIGYSRQNRIYFKIALLLASATAPGAILGAYLTHTISNSMIGLIFAIFLIILALRMISTSILTQNGKAKTVAQTYTCETSCLKNKKRLALAFTLSLFAGVVSGFLGIGGGVMLVPILLIIVYLPIHVAVGTSMFLVMLTSLSGVIQHSFFANIDYAFALLLGVGAFFGAQLGAWVSKRVSPHRIQLLFAIALVTVSLLMLTKYLPTI